MREHVAWLLSWLPWWLGYWPMGVLVPFLCAGWGMEVLWSRWRPGTAWLGEYPDEE